MDGMNPLANIMMNQGPAPLLSGGGPDIIGSNHQAMNNNNPAQNAMAAAAALENSSKAQAPADLSALAMHMNSNGNNNLAGTANSLAGMNSMAGGMDLNSLTSMLNQQNNIMSMAGAGAGATSGLNLNDLMKNMAGPGPAPAPGPTPGPAPGSGLNPNDLNSLMASMAGSSGAGAVAQGLNPNDLSSMLRSMAGTGAGADANGLNPNDLNSVMNSVLMNNTLQQQVQQQAPQQPAGGIGGIDPLLLQSMMNQNSNPLLAANNSAVSQMGGMNNLLQQGLMSNPNIANAMTMMGGAPNLNSLSALGGMQGGGMGGLASANNNVNSNATGMNNNATASAASVNNAPLGTGNNNNELLAQLMQNPMAAQLMAQGLNPLTLLGGMGGAGGMGSVGGLGQNQLGAAANSNQLGALALGMNGLGSSLPPGLGNAMANAAMPNTSAGDGAAAPHPNALFAFNNIKVPEAPTVPTASTVDDGVPTPTAKASKKHAKKAKVKGKPKRPLSAYNFFFRAERARILASIPKADGKKKKKGRGSDAAIDKEQEEKKDQAESKKANNDTESKEGGAKDFDQVGTDGKKIPHGKIGFENLAKRIGKGWQELDATSLAEYKKLADEDMQRYKKEMEVFLMKEAGGAGQLDGALGGELAPAAQPFYDAPTQKRKEQDNNDGGESGIIPKKKRSKMSMIKTEDS